MIPPQTGHVARPWGLNVNKGIIALQRLSGFIGIGHRTVSCGIEYLQDSRDGFLR